MRIGNYDIEMWAVIAVSGILAASVILFPLAAYYRGKRNERRRAHPDLYTSRIERSKDTALFLAALVPSVLVWLAVMGVSFIGLTGFARDVMRWDHWTNILVPLSLDGISVSFGAWAFVAIKRGRHPGRAYKIVLAAAAMSAMLNFVHGRDTWSIYAGSYLAFLSFAGMAMFHELIEQFMASVDEDTLIRSTRAPAFGSRWLWAPYTTFLARRAWKVHPVPESVRPTVANALHHLSRVPTFKGRARNLKIVVYAEAQLGDFPDGPKTTSRKPGEDTAGTLPGSPNGRARDTSRFGEFRVPHLPNGDGKSGGVPGGNGRGSSRKDFPEVSRGVTEEDQIRYLRQQLTNDPKLNYKTVMGLLSCRFDKAKALLDKAKDLNSTGQNPL